jgi:hypothetical protein
MPTHNFTKPNDKTAAFSQAVKMWAREIFVLTDDETIIVTELACEDAFCPDVMTLIVFWDKQNLRKEYRIYKAMRFITHKDVQESKNSMLNSLINRELAYEQETQKKLSNNISNPPSTL